MSAKIYIAIPCYNRRDIAEQCIPTVYAGTEPEDRLTIYDDGSQDRMVHSAAIMHACDDILETDSMGVDAQRRGHFLDFIRQSEFTHLYLTDSDAPHSPNWREAALSLQAEHKAPVCLYRTATHAAYANNVFRDVPHENVIWQRFAPGVSYLLNREMAEKVVRVMPEKWSWDWFTPGVLGYRMAISRVSYCDHIGRSGMHDPERGVGPERALNPTAWLEGKRAEILNNLGLHDA